MLYFNESGDRYIMGIRVILFKCECAYKYSYKKELGIGDQ